MVKPIFIIVVVAMVAGMGTVATVCFGSWLAGTGGCPAKMPWEMKVQK